MEEEFSRKANSDASWGPLSEIKARFSWICFKARLNSTTRWYVERMLIRGFKPDSSLGSSLRNCCLPFHPLPFLHPVTEDWEKLSQLSEILLSRRDWVCKQIAIHTFLNFGILFFPGIYTTNFHTIYLVIIHDIIRDLFDRNLSHFNHHKSCLIIIYNPHMKIQQNTPSYYFSECNNKSKIWKRLHI